MKALTSLVRSLPSLYLDLDLLMPVANFVTSVEKSVWDVTTSRFVLLARFRGIA